MNSLDIKYMLANPMGRTDIKHTKVVPIVGNKARVIDDFGFNKAEVRQLAKLNDIVTISEVNPIIIGQDGDYHWEYEIYTVEFGDCVNILGWHYELI